MLLTNDSLNRTIFFDMTTTPSYQFISDYPIQHQSLWNDIFKRISKSDDTLQTLFEDHAIIYPEFSFISCLTIGFWSPKANKFIMKSYSVSDSKNPLVEEKLILQQFNNKARLGRILLGWNIMYHHIPFIIARMRFHEIKPSDIFFQFIRGNVKYWEIDDKIIDLKTALSHGYPNILTKKVINNYLVMYGFDPINLYSNNELHTLDIVNQEEHNTDKIQSLFKIFNKIKHD